MCSLPAPWHRGVLPVVLLMTAATFAAVPEPRMPAPATLRVPPAEPGYPNPPFTPAQPELDPPAVPGYPEPPSPTWRHRGGAVLVPMCCAHPQMLAYAIAEPNVPRHRVWRLLGPSIEPAAPPSN